jgi:predicted DsbA family dithiol-disulfide isomerase
MNLQERTQEHRHQGDLQKQNHQQKNLNNNNAGQVKVTFYTDPLCCWSWAFEKPWREFILNHGMKINYRYIMCGMIPDWNSYKDDMNSITKPLQMGPLWMHASEVTHTPMKYSIWHEDPPASSYPTCIAVKTAGLQSAHAEELYLNSARRLLMLEGKNISKVSVLLEVARELDVADFSFEQFKNDWDSGNGKNAFRSDLQKAKLNNIGRFPTLTFQDETGRGVMMVGYRPYEVLEEGFRKFCSSKV